MKGEDYAIMTLAVVILALIVGSAIGDHELSARAEQCARRGGVYAKTVNSWSCVRQLRGDAK